MRNTVSSDRSWGHWLRVAMPIGILLAAAWMIDLRMVLRTLTLLQPVTLVLAFALATLDRWLMAAKWMHLLSGAGTRPRFLAVVHAYYQATMAGYVLPSAAAAEVVRGVQGSGFGVPMPVLISSMAIERVIGVFAALTLAAAAAVYSDAASVTLHLVAAVVAVSILAALVIVAAPRLTHATRNRLTVDGSSTRLGRLLDQAIAARGMWSTGVLLLNGALAIVEQLVQAALVLVIGYGLGIAITGTFAAVVILVMCVRRAVAYLESWLLGEGVTITLYKMAGISLPTATALALVTYAVLVGAVIPGVLGLFHRHVRLGPSRPAL